MSELSDMTVPSPSEPALRHIAMFLHGFEMGGAQRRSLALAGGLAALGVRVDLVVAQPRGPLLPELPQGINLVDVGGWRVRLPWFKTKRGRRLAAAVPGLALYLRRERPQVLLGTANHAALPALLAHRLAAPAGTALALRISNALIGGRNRIADRAKRWLIRRFYTHADSVLVVARALADEIVRLAPDLAERTRIVPNPVVDDTLPGRAAAPPNHAWLRDGGPPVVLGVGRLAEQKDFATLIRAAARVWSRRPIRLLILGDGRQRAWLSQLVRDHGLDGVVDLPGFDPNPLPAMSHAAVFVLSSRWEGMPGALIEAMACGCPVVSADCPGGSREVLRDGELGPLVPVGDDTALAQAIERMLDAPTEPARLKARAQDFSVAAAARAYHAELTQAVRRAAMRLPAVSGTGS